MEQKNIDKLNEFTKQNQGNFRVPIFSEERETRNINLKLKKLITQKIKECKLSKISYPNKGEMVTVPDLKDRNGKPIVINSLMFNKLCDKAVEQ